MITNGRIALVTGAGSGIGRAVSLALQSAGFSVVLAGGRAPGIEQTASLAKAPEGRMLSGPPHRSKPQSLPALFSRAKETFGRLGPLFNNARISGPRVPQG